MDRWWMEILRKSREIKEWRRAVLKANTGICCRCGARHVRFEVDHKIPLSVLVNRYNITDIGSALKSRKLFRFSNGQVLCVECHRKKTKGDAKRHRLGRSWVKDLEEQCGIKIDKLATEADPPKGKKKKKKNKMRKLEAKCFAFSKARDKEFS